MSDACCGDSLRRLADYTTSVERARDEARAERDRLTAELATVRGQLDSARQAESRLRETLSAWEEWSVDESDSPSPDAVVAMLMRERDELRANYLAALRVLMARTEERDFARTLVEHTRDTWLASCDERDRARHALAAHARVAPVVEAAPRADRPALVMSTHGSGARRRATLWAVVDSSHWLQAYASQDEALERVTIRVQRARYDAWGEAVGAVARLLEEPEDDAATRRLGLLRRLNDAAGDVADMFDSLNSPTLSALVLASQDVEAEIDDATPESASHARMAEREVTACALDDVCRVATRRLALLRDLVATLPRCDQEGCLRPATKAHGRGGFRACDDHADPGTPDYPRAPPSPSWQRPTRPRLRRRA